MKEVYEWIVEVILFCIRENPEQRKPDTHKHNKEIYYIFGVNNILNGERVEVCYLWFFLAVRCLAMSYKI